MVDMKIIEVSGLTKRFKVRRWLLPAGAASNRLWLTTLISMLRHRDEEVVTALDRVSLEVFEGEVFGVVGPNGAGKTTLLKCVAALLEPDDGRIIVNGYDVSSEPEMVKLSVSIVASGWWAAFDWSLTARENLRFFAAIYGLKPGEAEERVDAALRAVGLEDRQSEYPYSFSSGMRQRLLLAKAFLAKTPILIMDEPTVGVDPYSAVQIRKYIRRMSREFGLTILLTSHYMREVETICDRIAVMNNGRILACGSLEELRRMIPWKRIVSVEAYNLSEKALRRLRSVDGVGRIGLIAGENPSSRAIIRIQAEEESVGRVVRVLRDEMVRVESVEVVKPTLEDLYVHLIHMEADNNG